MAVDLYHWTPRKPMLDLPLVRRFVPSVPTREKNFGDEIGPIVVRGIVARLGLPRPEDAEADTRLFSVGSVIHYAGAGDVIWGSGVNGKADPPVRAKPGEVRITAVRGPHTRSLLSDLGFEVPAVYGDPALLLPYADSRFAMRGVEKTRKLALVPNFNDIAHWKTHPDFVNPLQSPVEVARHIAQSDAVVASSLHALVLADLYGTPAHWLEARHEHPMKYFDYFEGTQREAPCSAADVETALRTAPASALRADLEPLLRAFPGDLFRSSRGASSLDAATVAEGEATSRPDLT